MPSAEHQIARLEFVVREQMKEIDQLRADNERLQSAAGALEVLRSIYRDPAQNGNLRVKAASAALPHETPKLTSVAPPLDLDAAEIIPLRQLVDARRARQDRLEALALLPRGDGGDEPSDAS